jgi:microsomal dipeptidase-like Zn-dependent dipeptidase
MRHTLNLTGMDRVLFGTDSPSYRLTSLTTKKYLEVIRNLPQKTSESGNFTEEEIANVLGGNAKRIMGIS